MKESKPKKNETIDVQNLKEWIKCTLDSSSWMIDDTRETIGFQFLSIRDGAEKMRTYVTFSSNPMLQNQLTQQPRKEAIDSNGNRNVNIHPNDEGKSNTILYHNKAQEG